MSSKYEALIVANLYKLSKGMIIKNYKELCNLFEMEVKKGKGKSLQLKQLERYIKLSKDGIKYIVSEVYDEPLELVDGRLYSKNVAEYIDELELLLLDLMSRNGEEVLNISKSKLKEALSMVNFNYNYYYPSENRGKLATELNVDSRMINEYYQSSSSILNNALSTVFNRLERKKLIVKSDKLMIAREVELDDNVSKVVVKDATEEEIKIVLKVERQVLIELGLNVDGKYMNIVSSGKYHKYKNRVLEILNDEYDIKYSYKMINLQFDQSQIDYELEYILENRYQIRNSVNNKLLDRLGRQSVNEYNKAIQFLSDYLDTKIEPCENFNDDELAFIPNNIDKLKLVEGYLSSMSKINHKLIPLSENKNFKKYN